MVDPSAKDQRRKAESNRQAAGAGGRSRRQEETAGAGGRRRRRMQKDIFHYFSFLSFHLPFKSASFIYRLNQGGGNIIPPALLGQMENDH